MYSKTLFAGWADMDFNSHMRNTAFLDKSADVRMMFFSENGFPTGSIAGRVAGAATHCRFHGAAVKRPRVYSRGS